MAPEELRADWLAKVEDGSVAFGSAYHNWAINVPIMQANRYNF